MKVWIITEDAVTDVAGELFDAGGIYGVYLTKQAADSAWRGIEDTYTRKRIEYTVEEYEVQE